MTEPTGRTRTRLWTQVGAGLLVVLWAAAAVPLSIDAAQVARTHTVTRVLGAATDAVILQMQEERRLSAGLLAKAVERDALTAHASGRTTRAGACGMRWPPRCGVRRSVPRRPGTPTPCSDGSRSGHGCGRRWTGRIRRPGR